MKRARRERSPTQAGKIRRCAIYTRVSTDHGLEQDFNSLDAQREACEAFIRSQVSEGWALVRSHYDDGGFSGGSLDRPALQRLLEAVRQNKLDIIVVYKVDRLTRSLADFAKLVELFDTQDVSFVSVTQSFNTTSSMGRLTLNVLLSFAQFEREVTGERIRDKIAASKRKGIWMGGVAPLGYRVEDRKLVVDATEAAIVRSIFERYLALGSMLSLLAELRERGVRTRRRTLSSGREIGGIFFTKGPLAHLLKNRMYLGELNHRGQSYPADHAPIIDRETFEAVQARLTQNLAACRQTRAPSRALLIGKIFDDRGNLMTPSYAVKSGVRYRYYVSRAITEGRKTEAGSIARVAAVEIERVVWDGLEVAITSKSATLRADLGQSGVAIPSSGGDLNDEDCRKLIASQVARVTIRIDAVEIDLTDGGEQAIGRGSLMVPWRRRPSRPRREIIVVQDSNNVDRRPIRSETRATLLRAIANGRAWLEDIVTGRVADTETIAMREGRSRRSIAMMISLAFLAPDIVEAALNGRLPRGIGVRRLVELPPEWSMQRQVLGLSGPR
ncbi:recombinase family protein [Methylocystis sp. SB2]|uniref:recombinase family protein n=1 Tax=Methylocystis sp. (strain SB2) TaxID=743836 RepID=UPI0004043EFF|nr:recombinase family protein [Methylocystis sp. SB2]ULO23808.1 recombinase family protein [Methylocystis sp. SB2]